MEQIMCRACEVEMTLMPVVVLSRIKPIECLQCRHCLKRVLVYNSIPKRLKIWSSEFRHKGDVSAYVERRLEEEGLTLVHGPLDFWSS
jgi:hypothetical protein